MPRSTHAWPPLLCPHLAFSAVPAPRHARTRPPTPPQCRSPRAVPASCRRARSPCRRAVPCPNHAWHGTIVRVVSTRWAKVRTEHSTDARTVLYSGCTNSAMLQTDSGGTAHLGTSMPYHVPSSPTSAFHRRIHVAPHSEEKEPLPMEEWRNDDVVAMEEEPTKGERWLRHSDGSITFSSSNSHSQTQVHIFLSQQILRDVRHHRDKPKISWFRSVFHSLFVSIYLPC